jgi:phosphoglycolate phosphatase
VRFRAVLFDLDGTLLNTLEDLADAMNAVLAGMGHPQHPVEAYKLFVGDGAVNLAKRALPKGKRDKGTVRACVELMREAYGKNWKRKTRPYYGIAKLLNWLKDNGVASAVLSNKADDFTKKMVHSLLPHWSFGAVRGASEGVALKPPRILYLGDTGTDMRTAVAAGMYPAGAQWGFRTKEELLAGGAKKLFAKPLDVIGFLEGGS